jgi:hypothetical protein
MSTKKVIRGKRYSAEEKSKVVAFVNDYNAKNGRGGQLTAANKFKISQLTIATWLKKSGGKSTGKAASKSAGKSSSSQGSMQKKLSAMLTLGQEIEKLESSLKSKRSQFDKIKASL